MSEHSKNESFLKKFIPSKGDSAKTKAGKIVFLAALVILIVSIIILANYFVEQNRNKELIDDLIDRNLSMGGVVFNMANVSFMDSTGLGFLLGRYKKLKSYGVKAYIESPRCAVEKVMLLSGIYEIMPRI